jgi:hypothetical protein
MKKTLSILLMLSLVIIGGISAYAENTYLDSTLIQAKAITEDGYNPKTQAFIKYFENSEGIEFKVGDLVKPDEELIGLMSDYMAENDQIRFVEVTALKNGEPVNIQENLFLKFAGRLGSGTISDVMGKNYRVYLIDGTSCEQLEVVSSERYGVDVMSNRLGLFAIIYNPNVMSAEFYSDYKDGNEDQEYIGELYYKKEDISKDDTVLDIVKPIKDGYSFLRWTNLPYTNQKQDDIEGATLSEGETIIGEWFAEWIENDKYEPLKILISSEKNIYQKEEDGMTFKISISGGKWTEELSIEDFNIVTPEELSIAELQKIDDENIIVTIKGNSMGNSSSNELSVSFNRECIKDAKSYQLNNNGTVKNIYTSDNSISLVSSKKHSSTSSTGSKLKESPKPTQMPATATIEPKATPTSVPNQNTDTNNGIKSALMTFEIGDESMVINDKEIIMDVAPFISNERAFVPIRVIAETFGAEVSWNGNDQTVSIKLDNVNMTLKINSNVVYMNDKKIELDTNILIKNDRTCVPLRFITEMLGAEVDWNVESSMITVMK